MKNEITLKVYDVDYSFIIKNYLAPDLWQKTWTLFVYKNVRVTLELYEIEVRKPIKIRFKVYIQDERYNNYNFVTHDTENSNINVLKRQINGEIRDLIEGMEQYYIRQEDDYQQLCQSYHDERERLEDIAKEYLDDNGITLEDVRDAYIDKYVCDNAKGSVYMNNYVNGRKYKNLPDLWLVFYKAIGDDNKYQQVYDTISDDPYFESRLEDINEYIKILSNEDSEEFENYFDDMKLQLEGI